ncbi:SLATT domain-containing protein [Georgenia sp. Marseille-Q6866]
MLCSSSIGRLVAQPREPKTTPVLLQALEERSFTTYKSRLRAYERMQARNSAWNAALISLSVATTVAAVGLLVDEQMYGPSGPVLLAACAVLSLAASLVVASLDYPGRAARMEANYKEIQDVSSRLEATHASDRGPTSAAYSELYERYSDLVRRSENHTTADLHAATKVWSPSRLLSAVGTFLPYLTLVLPGWLLWQFTVWVIDGSA